MKREKSDLRQEILPPWRQVFIDVVRFSRQYQTTAREKRWIYIVLETKKWIWCTCKCLTRNIFYIELVHNFWKLYASPFFIFIHFMWFLFIFEQLKFCLARHKDQSSRDVTCSRKNKTLKSKEPTKSLLKFKITFLVPIFLILNSIYRPFLLYWCLKHHGQSMEVAMKRC